MIFDEKNVAEMGENEMRSCKALASECRVKRKRAWNVER